MGGKNSVRTRKVSNDKPRQGGLSYEFLSPSRRSIASHIASSLCDEGSHIREFTALNKSGVLGAAPPLEFVKQPSLQACHL
ncbi:hypothetical protein GJAV_G00075590 [Gymnothorax javanicus]|nr:hypothetical protein GJAV_G00075590 [Gymnothorax javanicus]